MSAPAYDQRFREFRNLLPFVLQPGDSAGEMTPLDHRGERTINRYDVLPQFRLTGRHSAAVAGRSSS
ncbi:MAG TPA: hypothetical protein VFR49_07370 [Solirubrobacteraceae bacterium]|nr:hypothetical protein [Solirubrobacteraceae bacterium]